jgi:O-antigen/teichoic acid export membrane protein
MRRPEWLRRPGRDGFASNVVARVLALVALALGTLLVARTGGPVAVGAYALLRVLPGLVGVVLSAGLPGAATYFLAGPRRGDRRVASTIVLIALAGGTLGTALWLAGAPLLRSAFFDELSLPLVALAGTTVLSQLLVATAKSCSQGSDDLQGANLVIVNEELMFLPAYGALWLAGASGDLAIVGGLLGADVIAAVLGWRRLARRGLFRDAERPALPLAREISAYGMRAQVGGVMTLLNLRLDFILLSVLAGPAVLGVYAIASKYAELLKVPGMALTYVLYPQYAKDGLARAIVRARRAIPRGALAIAGATLPLIALAPWIIPAVYGARFDGAVAPAQIITLGLALEGVAGVITGFLYGVGRPGLNSWAMGAGLAITLALDLLLIPPFGAVGAAVASAVAYVTSSLALISFFWWIRRSELHSQWKAGNLSEADAR